jgi:hypothetical protein
MFIILFAMVVIAAGAVAVNHYAFNHTTSPTTTITTSEDPFAKTLRACQSDGATVSTAIAAFRAENPSLNPTESELIGSALGGPYLTSWPSNPGFYSFSLSNGILYLSPGTSGFLTAMPSTRFRYVGPRTCSRFGL